MKFSREFRAQQNPAWLHAYVRYDSFKALIKALANKAQTDSHHKYSATLVAALQDDFQLVTSFYAELDIDVIQRAQQYVMTPKPDSEAAADQEKLELKARVTDLQQFGALNTTAFLRLLNKLDRAKLVPHEAIVLQRQTVLASRFSQRPGLWEILSNLQCHSETLMAPTSSTIPTAIAHTVGMFSRLLPGSLHLSKITSNSKQQPSTVAHDKPSVNAVGSLIPGLSQEEQLIHAAASGDEEKVRSTIEIGAPLDNFEAVTGRTPLCYASINGDSAMVTLLLNAGADPNSKDRSGLTIAEHAAYRGHHEVMDMLLTANKETQNGNDTLSVLNPRLNHCEKDPNVSDTKVSATPSTTGPISTSIIVNLGSPHSTSNRSATDYIIPSLEDAVGSLSLELSVCDATSEPSVFNLPFMEDLSNKPCVYVVDPDLKSTVLQIKLFRWQRNMKILEGTGSSLIELTNGAQGLELEAVGEMRKVPILVEHHGRLVAVVVYSLLIVTPAPKMAEPNLSKPWDFGKGVGGHRGLGQNNPKWPFLQIGENTIDAFEAAIRIGAEFVEFDVQVTKDLVPVIYHDFLVSETGTDAPVHTLSYNQFRSANDSDCHRESSRRRTRSYSPPTSAETVRMQQLQQRILETTEGRVMGFKPNTRGAFIQAPFTTLEQACTSMDPTVPFNIELKYPMLSETIDWGTSSHWLSLNSYLDAILAALANVPPQFSSRPILLSAFSPDICIALTLKKAPYPIYFLNDARAPTPDSRASSFQSALHFASRWELDGIVLESTPLVNCPRLISLAQMRGLGIATYGARNNDVEAVRLQKKNKVEGIIVDRVREVVMKCGA